MPIIPWRPFGDMDKFFDEDDLFLTAMPQIKAMQPAMDVYEKNGKVIAELNIPGIDPDKIDVSVKNQVLQVSGMMEEEKEEEGKDYWRKEIRKGSFQRMTRLPSPVDESKTEATYEKGVLKVEMPKAEKKVEEKSKIKVKAK